MKWITCPECEEEFKVITDSMDPVTYCPLCGGDVEQELDDEFEDE
jgi:rRNA maturation endonuclease Nob1